MRRSRSVSTRPPRAAASSSASRPPSSSSCARAGAGAGAGAGVGPGVGVYAPMTTQPHVPAARMGVPDAGPNSANPFVGAPVGGLPGLTHSHSGRSDYVDAHEV